MTAEPQIGYPAHHQGWEQAPTGLSSGFAGYSQDGPSGLGFAPTAPGHPPASGTGTAPPQPSFAGHDPAAPSGLFGPAVTERDSVPDYALAPQSAYSEPAPQSAYPESVVQAAYPEPVVQAAYPEPAPAFAPPPQAAYPAPQAAYPAPVGYPGAAAGGYGGGSGPGTPGYLQPYGAVPGEVAGRGPSVGPVVAFTLCFGVFGAISAARRSDKARAVGDRTGRYWIAFGATLVGSWVVGVIGAILVLAFGGLAVHSTARSTTEIALQQSIVTQGSFPDASGKTLKVKSASCLASAVAGADHDGPGTYQCALGLANGTIDNVMIKLDQGGRWRVVGQA